MSVILDLKVPRRFRFRWVLDMRQGVEVSCRSQVGYVRL